MQPGIMEERKWVVEIINDKLKDVGPLEREWERHSIYKVPSHVTQLNEKAYIPQVVSFGPYHHGEDHLKAMEDQKPRALMNFLKRCKKPIEMIYDCIDKVFDELRNSYNTVVPIMEDKPRFMQMMILDGCFMLEILRANCDYSVPDDYAPNDPIFGKHGRLYAIPCILRDMLMLENQLPLMLLRILFEVANDNCQAEKAEELLIDQILTFLGSWLEARNLGKCMHVLDVCRKSMIYQQGPTSQKTRPKAKFIEWLWEVEVDDEDQIVRSAKELHEAGIIFKKSETDSLNDVSFADGTLSLPRVLVDDTTEYVFLNLIAFEHLCVGIGNDVSSYVRFMDRVIDTHMDVAVLHRRGILLNYLSSDKAVAELFNSLAKEVNGYELNLLTVIEELSKYYKKKSWRKWRASLIQIYFKNPWSGVSLVAAICLFALTIIQTVYTIGQYYRHP